MWTQMGFQKVRLGKIFRSNMVAIAMIDQYFQDLKLTSSVNRTGYHAIMEKLSLCLRVCLAFSKKLYLH